MPAIQPIYRPLDIADQLQALKARDKKLWRQARVVIAPYYDQFAIVETGQTRSEREARFVIALTGTIFSAAMACDLYLSRQDGQKYRQRINDRFDDAMDAAVNGREVYESNLDRFLRLKDVANASLGSVTFELVTPARPRAVTQQYTLADQLAADCCV